jgi:integration host factor subunit beta
MTKAEIVRAVVLATGIETRDVESIVEATLKTIKDNVKKGKRVDFRGFGCFYPKKHKAKTARRPINGAKLRNSEMMIIPETIKPAFKPSKKYFACTI